jgi:hypothetical protein
MKKPGRQYCWSFQSSPGLRPSAALPKTSIVGGSNVWFQSSPALRADAFTNDSYSSNLVRVTPSSRSRSFT